MLLLIWISDKVTHFPSHVPSVFTWFMLPVFPSTTFVFISIVSKFLPHSLACDFLQVSVDSKVWRHRGRREIMAKPQMA